MTAIAEALGGQLFGDGACRIDRLVTPAQAAGPDDLIVALYGEARRELGPGPARCAVLDQDTQVPDGLLDAWIRVDHPRLALARLTRLFETPPAAVPGVHPSAVVEAGVELAEGVSVGPLCYLAEGAVVGAGTRLLAQVSLGRGCRIGEDCLLYPGVRIGEGCELGRRVVIYDNACIGAPGFSYTHVQGDGVERVKEQKQVTAAVSEPVRIASLGRVVIADDVEIGACSTVDRGTLGDTVIGEGSKLDNLTMVAHNTQIGRHCLIAAQTGLAGSCRIGDRVMMGGQAGVADHMRVSSDVVIAAHAGVSQHVPSHSVYIGSPAIPYKHWQERIRGMGRLKRMLAELERLKKRLSRLEKNTARVSEDE